MQIFAHYANCFEINRSASRPNNGGMNYISRTTTFSIFLFPVCLGDPALDSYSLSPWKAWWQTNDNVLEQILVLIDSLLYVPLLLTIGGRLAKVESISEPTTISTYTMLAGQARRKQCVCTTSYLSFSVFVDCCSMVWSSPCVCMFLFKIPFLPHSPFPLQTPPHVSPLLFAPIFFLVFFAFFSLSWWCKILPGEYQLPFWRRAFILFQEIQRRHSIFEPSQRTLADTVR